MSYRPGLQFLDSRFGAITSALLPTSVAAGLIGTCALIVITLSTYLVGTGWPFGGIAEVMMLLIGLGIAIALGSIAGTFLVAFYLLIFGWPVAFMLGERIRDTIGLAAAVTTAAIACLFAVSWMYGWPFFSDQEVRLSALLPIASFAIPASYLYRRNIINALDEATIA